MANIHVVPTFHHDIAYLQPEAVYTKMATDILDKALTLMEQDETYTFTVEQADVFREYFETHPEDHQKLTKFAQKGQLPFATITIPSPVVWSGILRWKISVGKGWTVPFSIPIGCPPPMQAFPSPMTPKWSMQGNCIGKKPPNAAL